MGKTDHRGEDALNTKVVWEADDRQKVAMEIPEGQVNVVDAGQMEQREIRLEEALDIGAVQALHAELKAAMAGAALILDGSKVTRVDTASLQVLVAMFVYADLNKQNVRLQAPSQALVDTAKLLGISDYVELKEKENN